MGIIDNYKYQRGMIDYLSKDSEIEAYIIAHKTMEKAILDKKEQDKIKKDQEEAEKAAAKEILKRIQDEMKSLKL
jgi:hypothetical protein